MSRIRAGRYGVLIPVGVEHPDAHPAPCFLGYESSFPEGNAAGGMILTTHLHLWPRKELVELTSTFPYAFMAFTGTILPMSIPMFLASYFINIVARLKSLRIGTQCLFLIWYNWFTNRDVRVVAWVKFTLCMP